jgi:hypothetical protein
MFNDNLDMECSYCCQIRSYCDFMKYSKDYPYDCKCIYCFNEEYYKDFGDEVENN